MYRAYRVASLEGSSGLRALACWPVRCFGGKAHYQAGWEATFPDVQPERSGNLRSLSTSIEALPATLNPKP